MSGPALCHCALRASTEWMKRGSSVNVCVGAARASGGSRLRRQTVQEHDERRGCSETGPQHTQAPRATCKRFDKLLVQL